MGQYAKCWVNIFVTCFHRRRPTGIAYPTKWLEANLNLPCDGLALEPACADGDDDGQGGHHDCSGCGECVPERLRVRTHSCPSCGQVLDRDENAVVNILHAGPRAVVSGFMPTNQTKSVANQIWKTAGHSA